MKTDCANTIISLVSVKITMTATKFAKQNVLSIFHVEEIFHTIFDNELRNITNYMKCESEIQKFRKLSNKTLN